MASGDYKFYSVVVLSLAWLGVAIWAGVLAFKPCGASVNTSALPTVYYAGTALIALPLYLIVHTLGYYNKGLYDMEIPVYALFQYLLLLFTSVIWPVIGISLVLFEHVLASSHCTNYPFVITYIIGGLLGTAIFSLGPLSHLAAGADGKGENKLPHSAKSERKFEAAAASRAAVSNNKAFDRA